MTKRHRQWDRRDRLLRAARKLLTGIIIASDNSVSDDTRPRTVVAERLYVRSKAMVTRIDRELT